MVPKLGTRLSGLIPAHAGKTEILTLAVHKVGAHPRSRGENDRVDRLAVYHVGSSPLTRGKPDGKLRTSGMSRLIPAHAGKTTSA